MITEKELYSLLGNEASKERIRRHTCEINRLEGDMSYSNYDRSTRYCMKVLKEAGFQKVERFALPADGKTSYWDYTMPQAWETTGRSFLRLDDPGLPENQRMIADSAEDRFSIGFWSAPTPDGGLDCEIVEYDTACRKNIPMQGKLILLEGFSQTKYRHIAKEQAAGALIYDSRQPRRYPDNCRWCNGIGFTGWYHVKEDRRMVLFSLTPRKNAFLLERLRCGPVFAHAEARTRIYDGKVYTVTGVVPGKSREEIVMVAHMYEPFLADDAAGGVVISEIVRCLLSLIRQGKLPPLRKTLRVVLSMERYGYMQYYLDEEHNKRILTEFSFDSCCHVYLNKRKPVLALRLSSVIAPSFLDLMMPDLYRSLEPKIEYLLQRGNLSDDTFCSDDRIRIPSCWPHSSDRKRAFHHNTCPKFMDADWDKAVMIVRTMGALIGELATFRPDDFRKLQNRILKLTGKALKEDIDTIRGALKKGGLRRQEAAMMVRFYGELAVRRVMSLNRYAPGTMPADAADGLLKQAEEAAGKLKESQCVLSDPEKQAAEMIVKRLRPGTLMSLVHVPHSERRGWAVLPNLLYMLTDGKRTLLECLRLYEHETGTVIPQPELIRIIDLIHYLEKYGYTAIRKKTGKRI